MNGPLVTVLLVTHNHDAFIDRAIASIESQIVPFPIEIVVADDASSDGTRATVEAWAERDSRVRVLPLGPRLGITLNYARGFAACLGRYIAVLEGDDEWISVEKLRLQAEHLETHGDISMVAHRVLLHEEATGLSTVIPTIGFAQMSTRLTARRLAEVNWFATFSCCMYRASAVERVSPEVFETTSFDWMINLAVLEFGPAGFLPQVMTLYRQHSGGEWSRATQSERDRRIRDLLPAYIELAAQEIRPELTRTLHELESRLRIATGSNDPQAVPQQWTIPIPRVAGVALPKVSVVMPCYNHERWIEESIISVLDQTMGDLELIVVDDGSQDQSLAVVARFSDPRMRVYRLEANQGAAAALNFAIQQARAEFVAVINSDDAWELNKLERQLDAFNEHPELGAVFTSARFVAEDGHTLEPQSIPAWHDIFRQPNRSQAQWLRFFMGHGNALCHPSVLIRRRFYVEWGLYDNRMRQIPDFERWIELVKHWPILVLGNEDLVRFRLLPAEQNASSGSRANVVRGFHEHLELDAHFFDGCDDQMLKEAFGDMLVDPHFAWSDQRACEIALLWWNMPGPMQAVNRIHSLRELRALLGVDNTALLLRGRYNFTDLNLHALAGEEASDLPAEMRSWLGLLSDPETWRNDITNNSSGVLARTLIRRMRDVPLHKWPVRILRQLRVRARA